MVEENIFGGIKNLAFSTVEKLNGCCELENVLITKSVINFAAIYQMILQRGNMT